MQHPWSSTVRLAVDLEAMGAGGKSAIFQVLSYEHTSHSTPLFVPSSYWKNPPGVGWSESVGY